MTTGTYIDRLTTKDIVKAENDKYIGYSYYDLFWGEWVGNVNIFNKETMEMEYHATIEKTLSQVQLQAKIDAYKEFMEQISKES